tara:strand:- start:568 stop:1140 length:573 start_codon:yes stop_codon:yes gene_type:complete
MEQKRQKFSAKLPDGYCIYHHNEELAGIYYRKSENRKFARGEDQSLEFSPEPSNKNDPNAVRIMGVFKDKKGTEIKLHIGYIKKDRARVLVGTGAIKKMLPRLTKIMEYSHGGISISFQIIGPSSELKDYQQASSLPVFKEKITQKSKKSQKPKRTPEPKEKSGCLTIVKWVFIAYLVMGVMGAILQAIF